VQDGAADAEGECGAAHSSRVVGERVLLSREEGLEMGMLAEEEVWYNLMCNGGFERGFV